MIVLQYKLDEALRKLDNARLALSAKVSEHSHYLLGINIIIVVNIAVIVINS